MQARYRPEYKVAPEWGPLSTDQGGEASGPSGSRRAALVTGEGPGSAQLGGLHAAGKGFNAGEDEDRGTEGGTPRLDRLLSRMLTLDVAHLHGDVARQLGRGASMGAGRRLAAEGEGGTGGEAHDADSQPKYGVSVRLAPTVTAEALVAAEADWAAALDGALAAGGGGGARREGCRPVVVAPRDSTGRVLDAAAGAPDASLQVFLCNQVRPGGGDRGRGGSRCGVVSRASGHGVADAYNRLQDGHRVVC